MGDFVATQDFRRAMPTPPEIETNADQFPPESTREFDGPPLLRHTPHHLWPQITRPPRVRPPPFPVDDPPDPPAADPWYIPVPPGIRAVYTTQAVLLRIQPEMNHPVLRIPPRPDRVGGRPPNFHPPHRRNHETLGCFIRPPTRNKPCRLTKCIH